MEWYCNFETGHITQADTVPGPAGYVAIALSAEEMMEWRRIHVMRWWRDPALAREEYTLRDGRTVWIDDDDLRTLGYYGGAVEGNAMGRMVVAVGHAAVAVGNLNIAMGNAVGVDANANHFVAVDPAWNVVPHQWRNMDMPLMDGEVESIDMLPRNERADGLLMSHLADWQQLTYRKEGYFVTKGQSGYRYQIWLGYAGNVIVFKPDGVKPVLRPIPATAMDNHDVSLIFQTPKNVPTYKAQRAVCIHVPDRTTPLEDNILAQKFAIENHEDDFLSKAYPSSPSMRRVKFGVAMPGDEA